MASAVCLAFLQRLYLTEETLRIGKDLRR